MKKVTSSIAAAGVGLASIGGLSGFVAGVNIAHSSQHSFETDASNGIAREAHQTLETAAIIWSTIGGVAMGGLFGVYVGWQMSEDSSIEDNRRNFNR